MGILAAMAPLIGISTCLDDRGRWKANRDYHYIDTAYASAIEAAGGELRFLPPYSPDFNPIEMAFSKLKAFLKKTAARTVDDLWDAIAYGIETFTPKECQNYFVAAGYDRE